VLPAVTDLIAQELKYQPVAIFDFFVIIAVSDAKSVS
jgi:hypothetical protein